MSSDKDKNELLNEIKSDKQSKISLVEKPIDSESTLSETEFTKELETKESICEKNDSLMSCDEESNLKTVYGNECTESETKDKELREQPIIKGRKLLRKADRIKTLEEENSISDDKKSEVLNKLANISAPNNSVWNNWFTDIKSAAVSATSTTVSHASNWSLNPKSILTSAKTITSQVGMSYISIVITGSKGLTLSLFIYFKVENVSSVVDSAIGAPPPEDMAAFVKAEKVSNSDPKDESQSSSVHKQNNESVSNSSKFNFGFVDYTLNTLELIGKKTMEVIVEDKNKDTK